MLVTMAVRLAVILVVLIAVLVGLRMYLSEPPGTGGHANELLEQLPEAPGEERMQGGGEMPGFPTTFPTNLPVPTPEMSPDEAVRTIMAALRDNDVPTPQSGVATTFNFASPGNKLATGPLPRFAAMVHTPAYAPLINHAASRVSPPKVQGNIAVLQVDITDRAGTGWVYLWQLSKQADGSWMTDAVQPMEREPAEEEKPAKPGT